MEESHSKAMCFHQMGEGRRNAVSPLPNFLSTCSKLPELLVSNWNAIDKKFIRWVHYTLPRKRIQQNGGRRQHYSSTGNNRGLQSPKHGNFVLTLAFSCKHSNHHCSPVSTWFGPVLVISPLVTQHSIDDSFSSFFPFLSCQGHWVCLKCLLQQTVVGIMCELLSKQRCGFLFEGKVFQKYSHL